MHPGAPAEPVLAAWGIDTDGKPVFVGLAPASSESTTPQALSRQGRYQRSRHPAGQRGPPRPADTARRFVVCHNPEQAERYRHQHQQLIAVTAELERIATPRTRATKGVEQVRRGRGRRVAATEDHLKAEFPARPSGRSTVMYHPPGRYDLKSCGKHLFFKPGTSPRYHADPMPCVASPARGAARSTRSSPVSAFRPRRETPDPDPHTDSMTKSSSRGEGPLHDLRHRCVARLTATASCRSGFSKPLMHLVDRLVRGG
jgi:hypothetical protein